MKPLVLFPQRVATPLAVLALAVSVGSTAWAEDIDIYAGADSQLGAPNVLFFLDNTSNWSSNSQAWKKSTVRAKCDTLANPEQAAVCRTYTDQVFGADTSLVQGQLQVRALKLVVESLVCGPDSKKMPVNIGLMLLNSAGTSDGNNAVGGYIRKAVRARTTAAECADLINDLNAISADINAPAFKAPASASYGTALYEGFKYFGGWTNPAGNLSGTPGSPQSRTAFGPQRYSNLNGHEDPSAFTDSSRSTYQSPVNASSCGNNYIVLVGNGWPNPEDGSDTNAAPHPKLLQFDRLGHQAGAQIYPRPLLNNDKSDVRWADEWARFLTDTDVSEAPGTQNLRLFTVDVYNPDVKGGSNNRSKQAALLKSMAAQSHPSGGGYFAVGGDVYRLVTAFSDIVTKIASVNSVFSSASLPVSVNAQGTFLNQVFMGVFRPDGNAQQRWAGNLKQYQFKLVGSPPSQQLILADKMGDPAVDESRDGGFLDICAASFWTTDSTDYWTSVTGMNTPGACTVKRDNAVNVYSDFTDGPQVERGGAGQRLRDTGHAARNIQTCRTAACSELVAFPNETQTQTPAKAKLAQWLRGENTGDGFYDSASDSVAFHQYARAGNATRPTVHGAVVHSRPLAVNYGKPSTTTSSLDDVVVFYGSGDGTLRAVNGNKADTDGNELWAFIAPEHFDRLDRVRTNQPLIKYPNVSAPDARPMDHFFDGSIGAYQERNGDDITRLWIYPTMRRGGTGVYAFDVTRKPNGSGANQPLLLWRYDGTVNPRMGQSWSTPVVIRVKGIERPLVVFGAGYDNCEDNESRTACDGVLRGQGIVVMDARNGPGSDQAERLNRVFGADTADNMAHAGRFAADIAAVDVNRDGYVDLLYALDTRGNVWRINTSDPSTGHTSFAPAGSPTEGSVAEWKITKIATVARWDADAQPSERRKFLQAPSVVVLGNQTIVLAGTGDREKPAAGSAASKTRNRFYGLRDTHADTTDVTPVVGHGDPPPNLKNAATGALDPKDAVSGWYRELSTDTEPYEQVVTTPLTLGGVTYFNTYQAKSGGAQQCNNLGTGRAYQMNFQTGAPVAGAPLMSPFIAGGIPPSPVGGTVLIAGERVPFVIGGPGSTPISPQKVVPKVRADRRPLYRVQRID